MEDTLNTLILLKSIPSSFQSDRELQMLNSTKTTTNSLNKATLFKTSTGKPRWQDRKAKQEFVIKSHSMERDKMRHENLDTFLVTEENDINSQETPQQRTGKLLSCQLKVTVT